jgi:hypothetical protein
MNEPDYPCTWPFIAYEIKKKADFKCENCGSPSVPGKILTVHHLDMNPQNCTYENLVALCQVCHLSIQAKYDPKTGWLPGIEKPEWMKKREKEAISEKIDCPECLGKGYIEEDGGGGNIKKFFCQRCNGKGTIELEEKENRDE